MKKMATIILLLLAGLSIISLKDVNAKGSIKISQKQDYYYENNEVAIFGNSTLDDASFLELFTTQLQNGKFVLIYDFSKSKSSSPSHNLDEEVVATAYFVSNEGVRISRTLDISDNQSTNYIKNTIETFFKEFISDNSSMESQLDNELAMALIIIDDGDDNCTFTKTAIEQGEYHYVPSGRIVFTSDIYRCDVNDTISLYTIETITEFIPGAALYNMGLTEYSRIRDSEDAQVTTTLSKFTNYYPGIGWVDGENPCGLEYWPKNTPMTRTIGSNIQVGLTLGYSMVDGFEGSLTGSFAYSQSYTVPNPILNAVTLTQGKSYSWYYDHLGTFNQTTHSNTGVLFEMKNGVDFQGYFVLTHDFMFNVDNAQPIYQNVRREVHAWY